MEQTGGVEIVAEERAVDGEEEEEESVLLVDLVEVALSLMREVSGLGKQVAQYNLTVQHAK